MTGLGENNFFSKCENQITKCVFPLENLQGMNYIALTINVGSSSEDIENAGIAHFLEHVQMNFFDKNEKRYLCSAYTDFYSTTYYFDVKDTSLECVIDIIQNILKGKYLEMKDVEKVRSDILEEYKAYEVKNRNSDFRILLNGTNYENHLSIGTPKTIRSISNDEIRTFFKRFYFLENVCIIWITSTQTLENIGDGWIANLSGEHGKIEEKILSYAETGGFAIKNQQGNASYYLYRERKSDAESINEDLLYVIQEFLKENVGKVGVEKIFLSPKQEFIKVTIEESLEWKDICIEIENLPVTEIEKRYLKFLKEEPIGYNCNSLREYFINAFTFKDMLSKEERNVQKDIYDIKKLFAKENIITNMRK